MVPTIPGVLKHGQKTSKKESLISFLQTQLTLKTELCGHYETDLKASDELVKILRQKLASLEGDDTQCKNVLQSWKKKVQELKRLCRQLEETAEDSKQERMECSAMDKASRLCEEVERLNLEKETERDEMSLTFKFFLFSSNVLADFIQFEDDLQQA